ncbi:hypothetical protein LJR168_001781 [Pseudoxanthomonas sp. LjRoot168]|uniref:hypothetical protein n=1 Tax=unclassified Pseudoxanthomonas TaxID=2645906 RepID=UPI003ED08E12
MATSIIQTRDQERFNAAIANALALTSILESAADAGAKMDGDSLSHVLGMLRVELKDAAGVAVRV